MSLVAKHAHGQKQRAAAHKSSSDFIKRLNEGQMRGVVIRAYGQKKRAEYEGRSASRRRFESALRRRKLARTHHTPKSRHSSSRSSKNSGGWRKVFLPGWAHGFLVRGHGSNEQIKLIRPVRPKPTKRENIPSPFVLTPSPVKRSSERIPSAFVLTPSPVKNSSERIPSAFVLTPSPIAKKLVVKIQPAYTRQTVSPKHRRRHHYKTASSAHKRRAKTL